MRLFAVRHAFTVPSLAVALTAAHLGAQAPTPATPAPANLPAPMAASAIPTTPAGAALREWLDAFNRADSARLAAFVRRYETEAPVENLLDFRRQTGGFNLLSIERNEPRRIEFFVRERGGSTTAVGEFALPATGDRPIVGPRLQALGPNMPVSAMRIDAATRARVVNRAAALLDSFYVFPEVARRMGDSARARLARGAYDRDDSGIAFARHLTEAFSAVAHDKHLNVRFSARTLPAPPPDNAGPTTPPPDEVTRRKRESEEGNCSFEKVERLAGNVGYLNFDGFDDAELCAPTVAAAMTFLAGTRALIIDLRQNGGGSPGMVALVSSYLFDGRTHLNDLWTRSTNATEEFWTRDSVAGRRFGGTKPVFVLTSARTFSGAEEFAYNLKTLKRATIVGETTGGGAHPVRGRRVDEHFMIGVPFARAINPITKTSWEGVGVEPDVKASAGDALGVALKLASGGGRAGGRAVAPSATPAAASAVTPAASQRPADTYVIVHGAWGGGWDWRTVDSMLTASGNSVRRATLTGLGERVHLASPSVGLGTHITDVVNLILFENLHDVVLVGHSYGGMVITGVADQIPDRIRRLLYVDAMLPESGESVVTAGGDPNRARWARTMVDSAKNGLIVPGWVLPGAPPPHDTPQPVRTFTEPLVLTNPAGRRVPGTYILTVEAGKKEEDDDFALFARRAKMRGFAYHVVESDHVVERTAPRALSDLLERVP